MNRTDLHPQKHDVSGLVAAISRNKEEGTLGRFLEPHRWAILGEHLHAISLPRGNLLISQGAMDRKLYFLESGSLKVEIKTAAGFTQLAILAPGTVVGEGSFFSHLSRSSSVIAYSDCKVWELSTDGFALLSKQHPTVALALSMALGAIIATRMHDMSMRIAVT
ncbi:MAG: cyclic nucleotide-binding domain-containing protein [Rhodoferax sp.]|jgi:CRP/FNR family cyclic AMP-dependent transcriptional regulator|nr:cyclic nucleotide-binding domain-containing protein [Rhodoferax sp.]MBP9059304.1 cyclic nucleotide-binding domain-containing protein [Rhodoferax sp.]MBP9684032.1 cyclic nucleotide-binding domain-containing protein [Rhodoferax sp.]